MNRFKPMDPYDLSINPIERIGKRWMLITAGTLGAWNTMTASWGLLGELWGRPTAAAFVRPSRHTFSFMEENERFTLSFLPDDMKKALQICGSTSGRDTDKAREAGITPMEMVSGSVAFEEAEMIVCCRKLYAADIDPTLFFDKDTLQEAYPQGDYHRMYVGMIESCFCKDTE